MSVSRKENSIVIQWDLFNQGCNMSFNVICEGPPIRTSESITYQIKGVPEIEKQILSPEQERYENEPRLFKYIESFMVFIIWPVLAVFSFWFWIDSIRNNPEYLENYHMLSDITWIVVWFTIFFLGVALIFLVRWCFAELMKK